MREFHAAIGRGKKLLLRDAEWAAIALPVVFALAHATLVRTQPQTQSTATAAPALEYDVASFKPNKSGPGRATMTNEDDGLTATNFTVKDLIAWAYGYRSGALDGRIFGAPGWLNAESYNVQAKMESSVSETLKNLSPSDRTLARQQMLQKLLADRCKLVTHRETRELPVFLLVTTKDGAKLQESKPDAADANSAPAASGRGGPGMGLKGPGGPLTARQIPIADLVDALSLLLNRPVVDKTGLTGKYDFTLQWTPDETQDPSFFPRGAGQPPDPSWPSLTTAIQEQLGLKLESGKGPVEVIVIDHVERPSGN
jgi:uncharacterized protein (TIGR03435 family)